MAPGYGQILNSHPVPFAAQPAAGDLPAGAGHGDARVAGRRARHGWARAGWTSWCCHA